MRRIRETRHEERTEYHEEQDAHNRAQHGGPEFALETEVGGDEEESHEHEDARGNRIGEYRRGGGHQRWQGEAEDDKAKINGSGKDEPQGERLLPDAFPDSTAPLHGFPRPMASPCATSRFGTGLKKRRRGHHCVVDRQIVFRRASLVRDVRAIRFEAGGVVKLVDVATPGPGPEDVLVQVLAAGVCRTELHLLDEVKAGEHEPLIPGHEIAGRITKIGDDVYTAKVGDTVGVHFEQPCGRCRQCRRQRTNLCEEGTTLGFDLPGGYAELVVAKQTTILPLPRDFDLALAAPLGCSGATPYRAVVALGQAEEDDVVVIIGAGGVGLSAVQVSKAYNARVFVIEPREEAGKAALDSGADRAVGPGEARSPVPGFAADAGADVALGFGGEKCTVDLGT